MNNFKANVEKMVGAHNIATFEEDQEKYTFKVNCDIIPFNVLLKIRLFEGICEVAYDNYTVVARKKQVVEINNAQGT